MFSMKVFKNVVAQFNGLPPLSLRGLSRAKRGSQPKQSGEGYEIATPRQVGARNDKWAWSPIKQAITEMPKIEREIKIKQLFLGISKI